MARFMIAHEFLIGKDLFVSVNTGVQTMFLESLGLSGDLDGLCESFRGREILMRRFTWRVALLPYGGLPEIQLATLDECVDFLRSLPSLAVLRTPPECDYVKNSPKPTVPVVLVADGATAEHGGPLRIVFLGPGTVENDAHELPRLRLSRSSLKCR